MNLPQLRVEVLGWQEVFAYFKQAFQKEGISPKTTENSVYFVAWLGGEYAETGNAPLGVVGLHQIGSVIRYKTDYVWPSHRGKGVYRELFARREQHITRLRHNFITAFCTDKSLHTYLNNGFKAQRKLQRGVTFVRRQYGE